VLSWQLWQTMHDMKQENSIQQWFQKPMKRKGKTHHNWDKIKAHGKIAETRE
jgi:hypothetical protein